jgi:hypothetical protein
MAVRAFIDAGTVSLAVGDNTLVDFSSLTDVARYGVTACSLYNNNSSTETVEVYRSPNTTSASGTLLDIVSIPADSQEDVGGLMGLAIGNSDNIIAVSSATGITATATLTTFGSND